MITGTWRTAASPEAKISLASVAPLLLGLVPAASHVHPTVLIVWASILFTSPTATLLLYRIFPLRASDFSATRMLVASLGSLALTSVAFAITAAAAHDIGADLASLKFDSRQAALSLAISAGTTLYAFLLHRIQELLAHTVGALAARSETPANLLLLCVPSFGLYVAIQSAQRIDASQQPPSTSNPLLETFAMDPTTATIVAAVIGALGGIVGAYIGRARGYKKGLAEGAKHSIERFMDVYRDDIARAVSHLDRKNVRGAEDVARALVENVKVWRGIQTSLADLLNGLITELDNALSSGNRPQTEKMIRTINEAYAGKRLAVEIQLKRSQI